VKYADETSKDQITLIRFCITGSDEAWKRLQGRIYGLINVIADRIEGEGNAESAHVESVREATQDVVRIAAEWVRAKVEKPTLENNQIRAEIAAKFAEAKRTLAEEGKLLAETRAIELENENKQLVWKLDNLERLLRLLSVVAHVTYAEEGNNGHLVIGPAPRQIGGPVDRDGTDEEEKSQGTIV